MTRCYPRIIIRLIALLCVTIILVGISIPYLLYKKRLPFISIQLWHRSLCKIIGLNISAKNQIASCKSIIFVSNHVSYLDILLLGSVIKHSFFVAKNDVAGWPAIGALARMAGTIFIERNRHKAKQQNNYLQDIVQQGARLIIFAEGTSSDGRKILPFKASLFDVAIKQQLPIQPITIRYNSCDCMPVGRHLRPYTGWYGDMDLAPHILDFLSFKRCNATIFFNDIIDHNPENNRKNVAQQAYNSVQKSLNMLHENNV